jgi:HPt (histidine-containing phosphotransfer) domain-containing protein
MPHTQPLAGDMLAAAPLPQHRTDPLPLDDSVLHTLTGGDPAECRALMDDFLAATDADLAGLAAAREAGDLAQVARQAHKIKGASRLVGAQQLGEAAEEVEAAAKSADWSQVLPHCTDVQTAAERLRRHVNDRYPR